MSRGAQPGGAGVVFVLIPLLGLAGLALLVRQSKGAAKGRDVQLQPGVEYVWRFRVTPAVDQATAEAVLRSMPHPTNLRVDLDQSEGKTEVRATMQQQTAQTVAVPSSFQFGAHSWMLLSVREA